MSKNTSARTTTEYGREVAFLGALAHVTSAYYTDCHKLVKAALSYMDAYVQDPTSEKQKKSFEAFKASWHTVSIQLSTRKDAQGVTIAGYGIDYGSAMVTARFIGLCDSKDVPPYAIVNSIFQSLLCGNNKDFRAPEKWYLDPKSTKAAEEEEAKAKAEKTKKAEKAKAMRKEKESAKTLILAYINECADNARKAELKRAFDLLTVKPTKKS